MHTLAAPKPCSLPPLAGSPVTPREESPQKRAGGVAVGTPAAPAPAASTPAATPASREPSGQPAAMSGTAAALATSYHALTQLLAAADAPASPNAGAGAAEAPSSPGTLLHWPVRRGGAVSVLQHWPPAATCSASACLDWRSCYSGSRQPRLLCLLWATLGVLVFPITGSGALAAKPSIAWLPYTDVRVLAWVNLDQMLAI